MIRIQRYRSADQPLWDDFIRRARNQSFLHYREYMDYHRDRYSDHSLLVLRNDKLVSVLPANETEQTLVSHGGLTFGGLITSSKWSADSALETVEILSSYMKSNQLNHLVYRPMPHIYSNGCVEDELYALTQAGAELTARTLSSCVSLQEGVRLSRGKKSGVNQANAHALSVQEEDNIGGFYDILKDQLNKDYGKDPVHTLTELVQLKVAFPKNIRLFTVLDNGRILAGSLIYETQQVAHAQYITANTEGREKHALDLLFATLLKDVYPDKSYFDFGISTEDQGRFLNRGLIQFKEGFSAYGLCYDTYEWKI